jgi:predicted MPP superfamily phosphohydrolase
MPKEKNRRKRLTRRKLIQQMALGIQGIPPGSAGQARWIEPYWVEMAEVELELPGLPQSFVGKRIVQISDVHVSRSIRRRYLKGCIREINHLEPDMVVLTGDYVTYDVRGQYKKKAVDLLGRIESKNGVFACLGNHDYGIIRGVRPVRPKQLDYLISGMEGEGITVLRNEAAALEIDGGRLWMVGLGDLWGRDFQPEKAFAEVPEDEPTIALAHNPDCFEYLRDYGADAVMCGHTHGGQMNIPLWGPAILPIKNKQYHSGLFEVGEQKLYVNRGLARLGRLTYNCMPEITVFTLREAVSAAEETAA